MRRCKLCRFSAAAALIALTSCAAQLERQAVVELQQNCAARGLQLVTTDSKTSDNLIKSQAVVTGVCVGPDDPRYVAAAAAPD